ncbi:flagellar hook-associated protein FlgL [Rhodoferax sp. GW822-FHT02A01]|uniref:flagellar hook-associated protein FlgL n=1 Tax=Rhodoferax sp. GW822-FHT02A01 TaxID=3141537 RepID=UPI00315DD397
MSITGLTRLGSANAYDTVIGNLETRQSNLTKIQEQLSTGKKITTPGDDPTGAAQAERALNRLSRIATDQRALDAQKNAITTAESTLGDITDALQQVRDLVSSAGNASYSNAERKTVANQIAGLSQRILSLANTQDSNGQPLFAALGSALKPFAGPATSPDYSFNGLPGTNATGTYTIPASLDGESAFMLQPARDAVYNVQITNGGTAPNLVSSPVTMTNSSQVNGSSYSIQVTAFDPVAGTATYDLTETPTSGSPTTTSGITVPWTKASGFTVTGMQGLTMSVSGTPTVGDTLSVTPNSSVFSTVDKAANDIANATTSAAASQAVAQALHNIDISLGRISAVRGQAGDLLNRADIISSSNDKRNIEQESNRSAAEDADMVKTISQFQNQTTGYQAALQSYAQIQKLSLFNYIS